MKKRNRRLMIFIGVILLILLAVFSRYMAKIKIHHLFFNILRSGIYIFLIASWAVSLRNRVIQINIQKYLLIISFVMLFSLLYRTIKYLFVIDLTLNRIMWYLYYFPMIFMPLYAFYIGLSLGNGENYQLNKGVYLLYIPACLLLFLVLTNDYHNLVFYFASEQAYLDDVYTYNWGYYLILGYIIILTFFFVVLLAGKCRIESRKKMIILPIIPLFLALIYALLYCSRLNWVRLWFGDMNVVFCLLIMLTIECCIQCGLIQSNVDYDDLFKICSIKAFITDNDLQVQNMSRLAVIPNHTVLEKAQNQPYYLDENTLLKSHSISGGYVYWQEDITEVVRQFQQLRQTQSELIDIGDLLAAENEQKARMLKITEEKHLYDLVEKQISSPLEQLHNYFSQLKDCDDLKQAKSILSKIVFIGAYIKRKSNLVFVSAQKNKIEPLELKLCFNETLSGLELCGVQCYANINLHNPLSIEYAFTLYDLFEFTAETCLDDLDLLLIYIGENKNFLEMKVSVSCVTDLSVLKKQFSNLTVYQDEDRLYYLSLKLKREANGDEFN
ncbi:MAG: hypothetical protein Q4C64_07810 [Erysipelotrichia bacterium]|nr:hypothetical protein [Erysipelotrichia bacterium]